MPPSPLMLLPYTSALPSSAVPSSPVTTVDRRPVRLNNPRPLYNEEARKNKVQGVVRVKVLIAADGEVKQVKVISGLPDGLNEEAIICAHKIRFQPATKDGQPVAFWQVIDITFQLP